MRILPFISAIFLFTFCGNGQNRQANKLSNNAPMKLSIHSFRVQTLSGDTLDFSTFKGKKILVVNTASKCGLTPQYKELEALYREFKDSNFGLLYKLGTPINKRNHLSFT